MGSSCEVYASNVNVSNSISLLPCKTSLYRQQLDITLEWRIYDICRYVHMLLFTYLLHPITFAAGCRF
jgi:hypothetical protein